MKAEREERGRTSEGYLRTADRVKREKHFGEFISFRKQRREMWKVRKQMTETWKVWTATNENKVNKQVCDKK